MEKVNASDHSREVLQPSVSGSDESEIRDEITVNGQTYKRFTSPDDPATLERDAAQQAAQRESEERAREASGHSYHRRFTGRDARDSKSAQVFASFDPADTNVQVCEFWKFNDSEIDSSGHF